MATPDPTPTDASADPSSRKTSWRQHFSHWLDWDRTGPASGSTWWHTFVFTFLFNACVAVVLTIAGLVFNPRLDRIFSVFNYNFLYSQCIGFSIQTLYGLSIHYFGVRTFKTASPMGRVVLVCFIPFLGVVMGWSIAELLQGRNPINFFLKYPSVVLAVAGMSACISVFGWHISGQHARAVEAERQATQAQLQMLQAQIEPHFLFNTLANVVSLVDYEPAVAKRMLETFIVYLRATLDNSRKANATLADESALIESYLQLLKIRMDDRLTYSIDIPEALRDTAFAPMLLQPLVENAVKHGLEPKIEGGHVAVRAWQDAAGVHISVHDNGLGLPVHDGVAQAKRDGSVGLANIRERLNSLFGPDAQLAITNSSPGVLSQIDIPLKGIERARELAAQTKALTPTQTI